MATYQEVRNRIVSEINHSEVTAGAVSLAVMSAINHYGDEPLWAKEAQATAPTAPNQEYYELPSDCAMVLAVQIKRDSRWESLNPRTMEWMNEANDTTSYVGDPTDYTIFNKQLRLSPIPDTTTTMLVTQRVVLPDLSDGAASVFTLEGEELIRYRSKWDIYLNIIENSQRASEFKMAEMEAKKKLDKRSSRYYGEGRIRPTQM